MNFRLKEEPEENTSPPGPLTFPAVLFIKLNYVLNFNQSSSAVIALLFCHCPGISLGR